MKTTMKLIFTAAITVLMTSCATPLFYQVYKVAPSDKIEVTESALIYEDENCEVHYDLWNDGGDIGFLFYNKTDENIFLNLDESFFILNGIAYDYYKSRVYTNSKSAGTTTSQAASASKSMTGVNYLNLIQTNSIQAANSAGAMTSTGYSISYTEERAICIPSKTSKVVAEYNIKKTLYRDCDLFKYPTKKQIRSKFFTKDNSPAVFSNRITYLVEQSNELIQFENEFYVTEISNYPANEFVETKFEEFCGQKSMINAKYFKEVAPDQFYIKYTKGNDTWKH